MGYVTNKFAKRLKSIREAAELTQEQLANELKVSRGAISYYEKGERTPDIEFLYSVSEFFDLPFDYLLGFTDNIKEEYRNMYELYGLTDEACAQLDHNDTIGHIISHIITDPSFLGIEDIINSMVKDYHNYRETHIDYLAFLLVGALKKLIAEAIYSEMRNQYTEEDIIQLKQELDKITEENKKLLKEIDLEEDAIRRRSEEHNRRDVEETLQSIDYIARQKVHEKLSHATMFIEKD